MRSWVATWAGDPPDPPALPPDQVLFRIDDFQPGNWMIPGFGTAAPVVVIPTLGGWGIGLLALLLAAAGTWRLGAGRLDDEDRPRLGACEAAATVLQSSR